jgi:GT2 family glycosyltransferase
MDAGPPKVSVVIPNRDGITPRDGLVYLELVLPSLREQTFRDFDVTVVDDASGDGSVEYLERNWPEVRVVAVPENLGFPAVVNRGISQTEGEYIALLNNDLELSEDWLLDLVGELDRDRSLGFVTGKVLGFRRRNLIEQAGQDLYTCGRFAPRGLDEEDSSQFAEKQAIPIATAAASLYRRSAVELAGGFDEDYFLYCEDADLCLRMALAGFPGAYVPGPTAFHVRGGTTGRESDLTRFYVVRNTLITLLKDFPASILFRSLPKIALYQLDQLRGGIRSGYGRTMLRAILGFLKELPTTLRKRRRVHRRRAISTADFRSLLLTEYPFPTRLGRLLR